jgi:hypothetical protein
VAKVLFVIVASSAKTLTSDFVNPPELFTPGVLAGAEKPSPLIVRPVPVTRIVVLSAEL